MAMEIKIERGRGKKKEENTEPVQISTFFPTPVIKIIPPSSPQPLPQPRVISRIAASYPEITIMLLQPTSPSKLYPPLRKSTKGKVRANSVKDSKTIKKMKIK